jgi:alpha-ketoglutarate-dependent taurine dioxygenase
MLIPRLLTNLLIRQRQSSSSYGLPNINNSIIRTYVKSLELKSINDTHAILTIDGQEIKYDWIFLRDSCQCHQCIDLSTKQKLHNTTDIPLNIFPEQTGIKILNNNTLEILWNQSLFNQKNTTVHRSLYSKSWLQTYSSLKNIIRARYDDHPPICWNRNIIQQVNLHIQCNDYLHTDQGFYTALKYLNDYGLVFLDNVEGELTIEHLVKRIGEIRQTFYGTSWDVKSVEQAINIAYTSQALGLHMDLLYFEAPPGLQFLHSLKNNVKGGASYYADAFHAAEILRKTDPKAFQSLCSYPVTFHYRNINRHYHFTRSTIVLNKFSLDNCIDHINYSPPFQAPFESDTSKPEFRQFIRAFQHFRDLIEDKNNQLELILEKNQCVIFHNRRILHARREFDASSGSRWLKGCYTDLDNFKDRLRVFREKFHPIQL